MIQQEKYPGKGTKWNGGKQFIRYRVQSNGCKHAQQHEKRLTKSLKSQMKNTISEMKNTLQGVNSRLEEAEDRIQQFGIQSRKQHQIWAAKRKKNFKKMRIV